MLSVGSSRFLIFLSMKKLFLVLTVVILTSVAGIAILIRQKQTTNLPATTGQSNVSSKDGKQIIQIRAKGGYAPKKTIAAAGQPTTLQIETKSTYDCSSAISIPSLNYQASLPPSGITQVEVPPQPAGTTLKGVCAMGMYSFAVNFQ